MMVSNRGSLLRLLQWQQGKTLFFAAAAAAVWGIHDLYGLQMVEISALPMSIVGAAIGIFASFRTNSAYDRWWEGRKLWGRLINTSRHWSSQVGRYVAPTEAERALRMTHRHIAYVHTLRCVLRAQDPFTDEAGSRWLRDSGSADLRGASNVCHRLLDRQLAAVVAARAAGTIDGHVLERLDRTLYDLLDIQGGCERIKATPLPRGYGFIVEQLIVLFGLLFPLALVHDLGWLAIPLNVLVCLSFTLISEAGRVLEDPFTMFWNGLPLSAMSHMIEVNVRERAGELDLPPMHTPDEDGILM